MTKRRRTSGIQRRERASSEALNRRIDAAATGGGTSLPDWRILAIGGVLLVGVILILVVVVMGGAPNPNAGITIPNDGNAHVPVGTTCRSTRRPPAALTRTRRCPARPVHTGIRAASRTGASTRPRSPRSQLIHNLEHGGIVIWYDPDLLDDERVDELASYVESQVATGLGGRFKFILTPWGGEGDLGSPVVVTAWRHLLALDEFDMDRGARLRRRELPGHAPEPNGGPGPS